MFCARYMLAVTAHCYSEKLHCTVPALFRHTTLSALVKLTPVPQNDEANYNDRNPSSCLPEILNRWLNQLI